MWKPVFLGIILVVALLGHHAEGTGSIVVVGGGLAGCSAAISAYRLGATVTLVEKTKSLGGNSAKASSGMNGAWSPAQKAAGIQDSVDQFTQDTFASGGGPSEIELKELVEVGDPSSTSFFIFLRV